MKTRFLIIIGMIIVITISVFALIIIDNIEDQSKFLPLKDDPNTPDELRNMVSSCIWNDVNPLIKKIWQNETHTFSMPDCTWEEIGMVIEWEKDEEQKGFEDLTCDEILKDLIPGLKFDTDDPTFNPERISDCMKEKEGPLIFDDDFNPPDNKLQNILDNCDCQESGQTPCTIPRLAYQNDTHSIDNLDCKWKLVEKDPEPTQLGGPIIIAVGPTPEPAPFPSKCKSGPAPSDEHYFDEDTCEWHLIPEPIVHEVFPYIWNSYLQRNSIDFTPKKGSYFNFSEGYHTENENRGCSPLITSNGTEFYILSTFNVEPLEIIETVITQIQPVDCHKTWKTDVILDESSSELWAWVKNYLIENEN